MKPELKRELKDFALQIRIACLEEFKALGFGHVGGSLSVTDVLAVLYGSVMKIDPQNPAWPERDKLVCSKGHAGPAVYATLALKGYFPYDMLMTLNKPGTQLPSHCDRNKTPGVDMTTGSLGQGTSLAAGLALGDKLKGRGSRVFLISGDGELDEGQVWEAAAFAAARKIDNLVWFIDDNKKQLDGPTEAILPLGDIAAKFKAFGFDTQQIPGNDVEAIYEAIERTKAVPGKPHAIVLDTIKGAGVKAVEETLNNHSMTVKADVFDGWIEGLRADLAAHRAQA
ncbi:MAG TPA: transketolase [Feifaniaceae bacterium]|nr:transketolase [Feifaniaceae bacterium]